VDKTDDYVCRELEDAVDDNPCDDLETEPSLGWTDGEAKRGQYADAWNVDAEQDNCDDEPSLGALPNVDQTGWEKHGGDDREGDGCADDREGDELQHGGEGAHENDEPSLGWTDEEAARGRTYAGTMGSSADLEVGIPTTAPQNRTEIEGPQIRAESSYRKFLVGLTDEQKQRFREQMLEQEGTTGVIIR
jgi:hypothetical protein